MGSSPMPRILYNRVRIRMAKTPQRQNFVSKKHQARLDRERTQNRLILIGAIAILVIVVGVIGYGILDQTVLQNLKPVATVNGERITAKQFEVQVAYSRAQLIQRLDSTLQMASIFGTDPSFIQYVQQIQTQLTDDGTTLGQSVLNQMIDDVLIRQEAIKRGITVSPEEVDQAMQEAFGYYANGTPTVTATVPEVPTPTYSETQLALVTITPTPTEAPTSTPAPTNTPEPVSPTPTSNVPTATNTPAPTATPYTFEGYQTQQASFLDGVKDTGFTETDLRFIFENQLYSDKLKAQMTADMKPEAEEVWARHILVADQATAEEVLAKLNAGGDWAKLASEYSIDTSNKDKGGDLGWFTKGTMVTEFDNAAFSMKVGEISQPIQTQFGWHIIQVLGHEVRPLTPSEFQQQKDNTFNDWLTTARQDPGVKTDDFWKTIVPTVPTLSPDTLQVLNQLTSSTAQ